MEFAIVQICLRKLQKYFHKKPEHTLTRLVFIDCKPHTQIKVSAVL